MNCKTLRAVRKSVGEGCLNSCRNLACVQAAVLRGVWGINFLRRIDLVIESRLKGTIILHSAFCTVSAIVQQICTIRAVLWIGKTSLRVAYVLEFDIFSELKTLEEQLGNHLYSFSVSIFECLRAVNAIVEIKVLAYHSSTAIITTLKHTILQKYQVLAN